MLAGLFAKTNYYMGDNLIPPRGTNPKGFFEEMKINQLNEDIINELKRINDIPSKEQEFNNKLQNGQNWLVHDLQ